VSVDSYRFEQVTPRLSLPAVDLKLLKVQKIYDKKIGGIPVRCVDINAGEKSGVLFCLDAASGLPVFHEVRMPGRALSAVYADYASLGSHSYAREIHEFLDGKLSREMTITNLAVEPTP